MEIITLASFLDYYDKIRARTNKLITLVPPGEIEWTYLPGKFTIGDLIRHIGAIERYMYAETVAGRPSSYRGCGRDLADGYENVVSYFNELHSRSLEIFRTLKDEDLKRKCMTPGNVEIATSKWLRAMIEHEIHHRGQLYIYLSMLGIKTPPIFGLTSEEVAARGIKR